MQWLWQEPGHESRQARLVGEIMWAREGGETLPQSLVDASCLLGIKNSDRINTGSRPFSLNSKATIF